MKMVDYWLIPILCLHSSILSLSTAVAHREGATEPQWVSEASKTPLTKLISKLLPSKLPQLEPTSNKIKQLLNNEIADLHKFKKGKSSRKQNSAGLLQEQGFVEKNGTYVIDTNLLKEHQEDIEELNRAEKNANFDLVEGLNMMAERNENLDDVVDEVLLTDKTTDVYSLN